MGYGHNRYGGGSTPDSADAVFTGRVESVGVEPRHRSGFIPALQAVGLTVTDVRSGSGVAVGDYVDLDVVVVAGGHHIGRGRSGVPALDASMVQPGVLLVAWANLTANRRWRSIDISTDGPASGSNYAGRSRSRGYTYGRGYATGLDTLDLTDYPTNVFTIVPDAQTPTVPRQIRQSDHDALERGWDRMMKGKGLVVDGPTVRINGVDVDLAQKFRELLRGGLANSPLIRSLFLEIVNDDAHRLTMHVVHDSRDRILIDAFQFDPNQVRRNVPLPHRGHHTIDIDDFNQLPAVSGNPRGHMMLAVQNLVHALREARQGVLGNTPLNCHLSGIADENRFRQEQGQIGALRHPSPVLSPLGNNHVAWRWEFRANNGTGALEVAETWDVLQDPAVSRIVSVDYFPA